MCITFFALSAFPGLRFLLAFNRDEVLERPTSAAHFWPQHPDLLGGQDKVGLGTWLAITRSGRIAFLTNCNSAPVVDPATAPSRGALVTQYLTGSAAHPLEYLQELHATEYGGFNLVVGDLLAGHLAFLSNGICGDSDDCCGSAAATDTSAAPGPVGPTLGWQPPTGGAAATHREPAPPPAAGVSPAVTSAVTTASTPATTSPAPKLLSPGVVYGLGNGQLLKSVKVAQGVQLLEGIMKGYASNTGATPQAAAPQEAGVAAKDDPVPWDALFEELLGDRARVETLRPEGSGELAVLGHGHDYLLSSRLIEPIALQGGGRYGTRAQTVLAVHEDGRTELRERTLDAASNLWGPVQRHVFHCAPAAAPEKLPSPRSKV